METCVTTSWISVKSKLTSYAIQLFSGFVEVTYYCNIVNKGPRLKYFRLKKKTILNIIVKYWITVEISFSCRLDVFLKINLTQITRQSSTHMQNLRCGEFILTTNAVWVTHNIVQLLYLLPLWSELERIEISILTDLQQTDLLSSNCSSSINFGTGDKRKENVHSSKSI